MLVTDFKALRCQAPRRIVCACDDPSRRPARAALQEAPPAARRLPRRGRAPPCRPPLADGCSSDIRGCPAPPGRRPICARNAPASGVRVRTDLSDSGSLAFDKGHHCMTDRPRERESVLQATPATRAMTEDAKGVWRRVKASRALLFRARASGCTVGYGFGMAAAGFASGSCLPALSGKPLSGAPFAGHTPGRLPIRLARRLACARWGCTVLYGIALAAAGRVCRSSIPSPSRYPLSGTAFAPRMPGRFSIRLAMSRASFRVRTMGVYGGVRVCVGPRRSHRVRVRRHHRPQRHLRCDDPVASTLPVGVLDLRGCPNPIACPESAFDLRAEFGSNGPAFSRRRPAASSQSCCRSGRDVRMTVQAHADAVQLYKRTG